LLGTAAPPAARRLQAQPAAQPHQHDAGNAGVAAGCEDVKAQQFPSKAPPTKPTASDTPSSKALFIGYAAA
jgi:hypothetical protein